MKRFLFLFLFFISLFASDNINSIVKNISKTSPEYSLDALYIKKIKTLKFKKENFNIFTINNTKSLIDNFKKLLTYQNFLLSSRKYLNDLNKKLNYLSDKNTSTQKLESLYYQKLIDIGTQKQDYIQKNIKIWEKKFYHKIFSVNFDKKNTLLNIQKDKDNITKLNKKLEQLKIDLEKWTIADNKKNILYIQNLIKNNKKEKADINKDMLDNYLILFFNDIKEKNKEAFKIENNIKKISGENSLSYILILNYIEKIRFGNTELILNKTFTEIKLMLEKSWNILNYPLFTMDQKNISLINFFIFIIFILMGLYIGKYYKQTIYKFKYKYDINNSTVTLLANIGYYIILTIAFLSSLKSIGLNLSSLTVIAGALSVGIGFGLQNIVSNFISGIILMFEKSIKIGDYIQLNDNDRGVVTDIRMRSLTIRTNDNVELIIPNQNFIQNTVTNWTLNDTSRRFRIPFGVAYGTDIQIIEKVVLTALENFEIPHYKLGDKKPQIIFISMGDSSINFELFVWVKNELTLQPKRTTSNFLKMIYKALNDANIAIPFPQQDLYVKEFPTLKFQNEKKNNSSNLEQ